MFRRWRANLADPATWRDTAYIVPRLPLCIAESVLAAVSG